MNRITKSQLNNKLNSVAKRYNVPEGKHLALDSYPLAGGYKLVMVDNETGGEWDIAPSKRVSASAMYDVLDGILSGLTNN